MLPLLAIPTIFSTVGKIASSGLNLAAKSADTATDAAQATAEMVVDKDGKEHAADSPKGKMIINMRREEETPEMFGGMDLNKIKSALDEDSPLGMPEEVKGGVYKQIFEVNKMMLGSLQRIEGTLKLMLNLEYERALAFQQADVQQNLIEGDTDPVSDDPEAGPGRFRRGLSSARGMLGGAYSKAKDSSIMKLLGLGALIFAFNKYKDEIIAAMAGILEYFSDVYDVFKSDGIGAAFDKVLDDFKTIFLPKIKEMSMNLLDFLWGAIKGVALEWIFGSKGDTRIRQESGDAMTAKGVLEDKTSLAGAAIAAMTDTNVGITGSDRKTLTEQGVDDNEFKAIQEQVKRTWEGMLEIYRQSDGRIQFSGIKSMENTDNLGYMNYTISDIMNAMPIIDGVKSPWSELKDIELMKRGGITKGMTEERQNEIIEALKEKSTLARQYDLIENQPLSKLPLFGINTEEERADKLTALSDEMRVADRELKNLGQIFAPAGVSEYNTPNKTPTQIAYDKIMKERAAAEKETASRVLPPNLTSIGTRTVNNVNASTNNNIGLSAHPTSDTVKAFKSRQLQELIA